MKAVGKEMLNYSDMFIILCGIGMGTIARMITLKVDTRQNPSFPTGTFINMVLGFIASALGAVAIPALLAKDFVAVTFLTVAVQQFREIRNLEKESLTSLEHTEFAKRGEAYIDGISKTYEARNYISFVTSFVTVMILKIFYTGIWIVDILIAAAAGLIVIYLLQSFTKGKRIGDICTVSEGIITIEQSELYVDDMFVTNLLGTDRSRELFEKEGVAFVIKPNNEKFRVTLDNSGQRQAMLYEAVRSYGVKRYKFIRRNFDTGCLLIAFVPLIRNLDGISDVIKSTPVLENSRKIHSIMSTHK